MAVSINDGSLKWVAEVDFQNLAKDVDAIKAKLTGITTSVNKESTAVEGLFKRTVASIAAYATFTAGANLIQNIVQVRGEFQQLEVAFSTMLQSKVKADKLLAEITEFAATTPFELKDVAKATKQLLAFGIGAEDIKDTLKSLGDVSAGIGAPLGEIAYLFGTIKTQGVAMTQDIRQFASRGIPIYEELSKVLGVSVEKVGELITAGRVGFPQIQAVFKNLTAEGSKFGGLMEAQSKTLLGLQSNLRDAIDQMFNDLGKSSEGIFATIIKTATSLVKNYEKVVDVIQILVITYGAYRAALILTNIAESVSIARKTALFTTGRALTAMQIIQTAATAALTRVTKLLNLTMLANPFVAVTTVVVGLVAAMALLTDSTTVQERAQKALNESNEDYQEDIENLKSKTSDLVGIISNETNTRFQQVEAFQKLKALYPDLLRNTDLMNFKTLSAEDAQKKFNQSIDELNIKNLRDQYKSAQVEVEKLTNRLKDARDNNLPGNTIPALSDSLDFAVETAKGLNAQIVQLEQNLFDANTPIVDQIKHYEKIKDGLLKQRDEIERNIEKLKEAGATALDFRVLLASVNLDNLNKDLDKVQDKLGSFTNNIQAVKDKSFFTAQKSKAQGVIDALVVSDVEFNKKKAEQVEIIRNAEKELEKYDTTVSRNTRSTRDNSKSQSELNSLLNERAGLIKNINDQVKASLDFGKTDQQKELQKINERYDELILNIDKYNKKIVEQGKLVDTYNRKNPDKQIQKIGQLDILKLNQARATDLNNVFLREDAEKFKENLEKKQLMYEQYEEAKRQVGVEKANELFAEETKDFKSFLSVLSQQAVLLAPKFLLGIQNEGDKLKLKSIFDLMGVLNKKSADEQLEQAKSNFSNLLSATKTFNDEKAVINQKYDDLENELNKNKDIKDFEERKDILKDGRQQELVELKNHIIRQSALYKKLNLDIIGYTRKQLKSLVKELENVLKLDKTLTPQMKADVQSAIDQYKSLLNETNETSKNFKKVAEGLAVTSNVFGQLAASVSEFDQSLGNVLQQISDVAKIGEDAANAFVAFSTGDIAGGITSAANAIQGIIEGFAKAAKSARDAKQAIIDFQTNILAGEAEYDLLIRERQRNEVKAHKLKLQGLEDEKKLLQDQRKLSLQAYDDVLKKLQSEDFISGQKTKKKRGSPLTGILGFFSGTRTEVQNELSSLAGKTFEEMEKLFTSGQLTDSAKKLFEQLQKIKAEGVDIDRLLEENKLQAQQIFTGTTAESISDSIIQGLEEGKRGVADFASNFEDLMKQAFLNSLKFKYLEGPIQSFFEDFAAASESDGQLTSGEIDRLKTMYNSIITNAADQFEQLQQVAGINFDAGPDDRNTLTGAIRGMTEQQAELLAGQFGGLRITAIDQLRVAMRGFETLQNIEGNTARLIPMYDLWRRIELNGLKVI